MFALLAFAALAPQNGDVKGEEQSPLRAEWRVPVPKALSPEEELATFDVDAGLKVELVACEPLVVAPVCAVFDERGRLWVCEMRTYMQDADGAGEAEPKNAVVVLTDENGDGRMDRREVFLDELVLPRAVAPTRGGALIISPPRLLFARDTDGDGRADDVRVMDNGLQGISSPEHAINGLLYSLDNWFWCANAPWRYRWNGERLERGRTAGGGQWGITEDRYGRIFYNDNSNPLRCDLYPSHYAVRNPNLGVAPGMGVDIARGSRPSPSHLTPGVNRGYRGSLLVDGRLNEFTGACAPWIYEGDALPERYRGDAFVCEPCGNLVHDFDIGYGEFGNPKAETAAPDGAFLTSTDERFRPVFLNEGPDGALYVVDMYRGVLQHRLFVTSWLRQQMEERELETPIDLGRIWRVTRADAERKPMPDLVDCSWTELAAQLDSPNRWMRKTAQRLFVEQGEGSRDALTALSERRYVSDPGHVASAFVGKILWFPASGFPPPLRTPPLFASGSDRFSPWLEWWSQGSGGPDGVSLGWATTEVGRGALAASLCGREVEFVRRRIATPDEAEGQLPWKLDGALELAKLLSTCVVRDGRADCVNALLEIALEDSTSDELASAIVAGVAASRAKDAQGSPLPVRLSRKPGAFEVGGPRASSRLEKLDTFLIWPGKPGTEGMWPREMTEIEQARFERGQAMFEQNCASCHQISGLGDVALAPPLRDSRYVLGDAERLSKILLHGLRGPVSFDGRTWDGEMPSLAASDEEIASVLTYLRRAWNHTADPIEPGFVRSVREQHASRKNAWSVSELEN